MKERKANPYQSSLSNTPTQSQYGWIDRFAVGACIYYIISAITLPFTNKAWVGEIPVFSILQIPKCILKSVVHDILLHAVHSFGWSRGSASPDYSMTHPWAMTFMLTIPALLLVLAISYSRTGRTRTALVFSVVACGAIDAVVTLWFDASGSLKIYNGRFF